MKQTFNPIILGILFVLILSGCSKIADTQDFSSEFFLGVIETTEQMNKSFITLYDDSLESTGEISFKLGSMGSFFHPPQIINEKMYVVPQGIGNQKELTVLLEFSFATGESRNIDVGLRGVNSFYVTEKYAFASSTVNAETVISRTDLANDQSVKTTVDKNAFIEQMLFLDGRLYVFGVEKNERGTGSFLSVYESDTLKLIKEIDTSHFGASHLGVAYVDGSIYITASTKPSTRKDELPDNRLIKYDIKTGDFTAFTLEAEEPSTLSYEDGKLYILHSNLVTGESRGISIFDIKKETSSFTSLSELHLSQIEVVQGDIYALSDSMLYKYSLADGQLNLIAEKDVHKIKKGTSHYYVSGMFFKRK